MRTNPSGPQPVASNRTSLIGWVQTPKTKMKTKTKAKTKKKNWCLFSCQHQVLCDLTIHAERRLIRPAEILAFIDQLPPPAAAPSSSSDLQRFLPSPINIFLLLQHLLHLQSSQRFLPSPINIFLLLQHLHHHQAPVPETFILQGDIAVPKATSRNADSCTLKGCKWPKRGSYVRVPYYISTNYTQEERNVILEGLKSFEQTTCIRFVPYRNKDRDFIYFDSKDGCWSYLGRQKRGQFISLNKDGCLSRRTVQHEVLHALGFNHEQVRSDRDRYVLIYPQNIKPGNEHNFQKKETNNLGTPYDFKSVMQYGKYAFSKNGLPTIVAKSDSEWDWGRATQMSVNDIARVNKLYKCK